MGGKRKQKKRQHRNGNNNDPIRNMIERVTDDDVLGFECVIPTDEVMDMDKFPNPHIRVPSHNWLHKKLLDEGSEWSRAWGSILKDDGKLKNLFLYGSLGEEAKEAYRERIVKFVGRSKRVLMYKKWLYAKKREVIAKGAKEAERDLADVGADDDVINVAWEVDKGQTSGARDIVEGEDVVSVHSPIVDDDEKADAAADVISGAGEEDKGQNLLHAHTESLVPCRLHATCSGFDSEQMASNMEAKNKRKGKKNSADLELRPTICLFVEHSTREIGHSLYMIRPPLDLSDYDQMIDSEGFMADSKYISPVVTIREKNKFVTHSACVNLGSKLYFFGGWHDYELKSLPEKNRMMITHQLLVFDTNHPEQGMQSLAPMNGPKENPCAFVADGMIYALGSAMGFYARILPGCKGTGFFERYDPSSNQWQVLSDPPLPFRQWAFDCATMVGRRVFIGGPSLVVIFNLDTQDWDPLPPLNMAARFPCGSLFVPDTASLYHLRESGVWKPGTFCRPEDSEGDLLRVVKRGPLTTTKEGSYDSSLLKSPCLVYGKEQVMATDIDLQENTFFTNDDYHSWRDLFHMGGRFFCYVVTAYLVQLDVGGHYEPYSRGVWIKFFEEVPALTHDGDKAHFRPLASFCYKIDTDFKSISRFIRCCVLGTVPDSWIKSPLKKNQDSKLKHTSKESEALQIQVDTALQQDHSKTVQLGNAENRETRDYNNLTKLLGVKEDENRRLAAELAKKNELLKSYEALLAKTQGGMTLL